MKAKALKVWNTTKEFKEKDKTPNRLPTQKDLTEIFLDYLNWEKKTLRNALENLFVGVDYRGNVLFLRIKRKNDKKLLEAERWYKNKFYDVQDLPKDWKKKIEDLEDQTKVNLIIYLSNYHFNNPFRKGERFLARSNLTSGSREKVRRALRDLEEMGFIQIEKGENKKKVITFKGLKEEREEIKKKAQNRLEELEKEEEKEKFKKLSNWVSKKSHLEGGWVSKNDFEDKDVELPNKLPKGFGLVKNETEVNGKVYVYWKLAKWNNGKNHSPKYLKSLGNVDKVTEKEAKRKAILHLIRGLGVQKIPKITNKESKREQDLEIPPPKLASLEGKG